MKQAVLTEPTIGKCTQALLSLYLFIPISDGYFLIRDALERFIVSFVIYYERRIQNIASRPSRVSRAIHDEFPNALHRGNDRIRSYDYCLRVLGNAILSLA